MRFLNRNLDGFWFTYATFENVANTGYPCSRDITIMLLHDHAHSVANGVDTKRGK